MSKKNKNNGLSRQGVRDLNYIKAPPRGRILEMQPEPDSSGQMKKCSEHHKSWNANCEECTDNFREWTGSR